MLVEVHILQNHAPSNLNRDDTGSPKEAVFGGHKRARISSQCIKRSIRRSGIFQSLFESGAASTRTRSLPVIVRDRLIEAARAKPDPAECEALLGLADVAAQKLRSIAKSDKKGEGDKTTKEDESRKPVTAQTIFFRSEEIERIFEAVLQRVGWDSELEALLASTKGQKELVAKRAITQASLAAPLRQAIETLLGTAEEDPDDDSDDSEEMTEERTESKKKGKTKTIHDRLKALSIRHGSPVALAKAAGVDVNAKIPVDMALFGRMVTNPAFLQVEASSQFAHAISTHKIDHEFDYYTAVDDLERAGDDEAGGGADMIGDVEFNSACYYKYFNIHVDGLVDNLTGKAFKKEPMAEDVKNARETAGKAISALIEAACRVTPSGKQNSFAAHQPPSLVWIEVRDRNLPVSYANAFSQPVNPKAAPGLEHGSAEHLKKEAETLAEMYGLEAKNRWLLAKHDLEILGTKATKSLQSILDEVEKVITGA